MTPEEVGVHSTLVPLVFQVTELECVSSQTTAIKSQKTELNLTIEELEAALKAKEEVRGGAREENRPFDPDLHPFLRVCFRN